MSTRRTQFHKLGLIALAVLLVLTTVGAFPVVTLMTQRQPEVSRGGTASIPPRSGQIPQLRRSNLTKPEQRRIETIEREEIALRGLRPLRPVGVRILKNKPFSKFINHVFSSGLSNSQIKIADIESVMLGLFPASVDLKKIVTSGLSGQVVGLYDHHTKKLYIRDSGQAFGIDRWTIAHEYTHAMQDQHFNLNRVEPDQTHWRYKNSDADLAEHSLIEGDAVRIQQEFARSYYTSSELAALLKEQQSIPPSHIPSAIEEQFTFPYVQGLQYVEQLQYSGGNAAVNHAFLHPPLSTYRIMFGRTLKPTSIHLRSVRGRFAGWKVVDDDVLGAFGYQQLIEKYVPRSRVMTVPSLWRGDRYVLLRHGKQNAMYLESAYQTPRAARTAAAVLETSLATRFETPLRRFGSGMWTGRATTYAAVRTKGTRVVVAYALSAAMSRELATAPVR